MTPTIEEVNAYLEEAGEFTRSSRITVEKFDPTDLRVRWKYDETTVRPGNYISGPALFTIADLCGWLLVFTTEGITPMAVTWDLHITFLRPAKDGDVIAVARQLKRGRKLIYGDVEMHMAADPDKPVAHAVVTYVLP